MGSWRVARYKKDPLIAWEKVIKPGIAKLAKERYKEMKEDKRCRIMHLNLMQATYMEQLHFGHWEALKDLKLVQKEMTDFYECEANKIMVEAKTYDLENSEKPGFSTMQT